MTSEVHWLRRETLFQPFGIFHLLKAETFISLLVYQIHPRTSVWILVDLDPLIASNVSSFSFCFTNNENLGDFERTMDFNRRYEFFTPNHFHFNLLLSLHVLFYCSLWSCPLELGQLIQGTEYISPGFVYIYEIGRGRGVFYSILVPVYWLANFFYKGSANKNFRWYSPYMVSAPTFPLWPCSMKPTIDNT